MGNLNISEKSATEILFDMESGYVLNFSDSSFKAFVLEATGINIFDSSLSRYAGLSKAKKLREFLSNESPVLVGKLLKDLIEYVIVNNQSKDVVNREGLIKTLQTTAELLITKKSIENLDAIDPFASQQSMRILVSSIKESCRKDEPEAGLDRLHTLMSKYLRDLLSNHSVTFKSNEPLNSLMGAYTKSLKCKGHIESEMAELILKSSISVLERFNFVRNNLSLAHPNETLNKVESKFVVSAILNIIEFIHHIENGMSNSRLNKVEIPYEINDDIPF